MPTDQAIKGRAAGWNTLSTQPEPTMLVLGTRLQVATFQREGGNAAHALGAKQLLTILVKILMYEACVLHNRSQWMVTTCVVVRALSPRHMSSQHPLGVDYPCQQGHRLGGAGGLAAAIAAGEA
jgi:hypothetical protein